jgi:ABC-2 type transport system ATP-binding protein
MSDDRPPVLAADGLTKTYGATRALDQLHLTVTPGEIVGLLGPNGSGKSTALRLVLGFLRPTAGRVTVGRFDCWRQGVAARRMTAYLPGELRLYENLTGRELVRFLGRLRGEDYPAADVADLARRLDIDLSRPLVSLSSGMKRKAALLTVLLPRVPLVILDEPTNTLDPTMRDELLDQLRLMRDRGQAVLFSSHVLTEVEQVCDRVAVLRQGRLVHLQSVSELRGERCVRARFPQPPAAWPDLPGLGRPRPGAGGEWSFDYRGPLPPLLEWLARQGVAELAVEPAGLSAVYHRYHGAAS